MFRLKKKAKAKTVTVSDPIVCRITVYNHAIKAYIAQHDIKQSERYLIGAIKAQYPAGQYRLEVTCY